MNQESMMGLCPERFGHAVRTIRFVAEHFDNQKCFGRSDVSTGCRNVTTRILNGFNTEVYCAVGCLMNDADRKGAEADPVSGLTDAQLAPTHDNRLRGNEEPYYHLAFMTKRGWSDFLGAIQSYHDHESNPVWIKSITDLEIHRTLRMSYSLHWLCERLTDRWQAWEAIDTDMTAVFNPTEVSHLRGIIVSLKEYAARR